jgi:hypothetical protein
VAGNANSGQKRVQLPKGEDAEKELQRLRRAQRRKERREAKRLKDAAEVYGAGDDGSRDDSITGVKSAMPLDRMPTAEELKRDLMAAFHSMGGLSGLVAWGQRYPKEFYALWGKYCLPEQKDSEITDDNSFEALLMKLEEEESNATQH